MGTFGTGPIMTTKPYVSAAAYIHRMSNFCDNCAFDPKTNCPITNMYWAFFKRHKPKLQTNPRLGLSLNNLQKRGQEQTRIDQVIFDFVRNALKNNKQLTPLSLETALSRISKKRGLS